MPSSAWRGQGRLLRAQGAVALESRLLFGLDGAIPCDDGGSLGAGGARGLPCARHNPANQDDEHGGHARHERLVPARELLQLVHRTRGPRDDRLVVEIPPDVDREI
ncbi:MAG: hypothetical protein Q7J25_08955 [Vicinamibacterales bacterium]|nr:hypothetical protein [Vicinamibacterales bacterium]